jgi:hypothetical protein
MSRLELIADVFTDVGCGSRSGIRPAPTRIRPKRIGRAPPVISPFLAASLDLSWADAVSNDGTPHAERFLHSLRRVSRSLVLHFGVELGSD